VLSRLESDNRLRGVEPSEVPLRFKVRSVTGESPTPEKVVGESTAAKWRRIWSGSFKLDMVAAVRQPKK
jgi:hypothetical protein